MAQRAVRTPKGCKRSMGYGGWRPWEVHIKWTYACTGRFTSGGLMPALGPLGLPYLRHPMFHNDWYICFKKCIGGSRNGVIKTGGSLNNRYGHSSL